MIYISSSCVQSQTIKEAIETLINCGFKNIELSGGTKFYHNYENDIIELKEKNNLEYLIHNYFPPPQKDFVLNLASLDDFVYEHSISHAQNALQLAKKLNTKKIGFHAGFFINLSPVELGEEININPLFNKDETLKRFCSAYDLINDNPYNIDVYIENNVLSAINYKKYNYLNPFMLTNWDSYVELKNKLNIKLLLDVGHLKVSAASLSLKFEEEFEKFINESDYLHISDNDNLSDQNLPIDKGSILLERLRRCDLNDKTITLEVNGSMKDIISSYENILSIL